MQAGEPAVRIRGLTKRYRLDAVEIEALRGIDLEIPQGQLCALMGPSGSGKTTLLNILGCLDVPTSGTYELAGQAIRARDFNDLASIRAHQIGFIFQTFNLVPVLTVAENVELAMLASNRYTAKERRARVQEVVGAVGLSQFMAHRPDKLSAGQRQRVAIARALTSRPQILLADEPTSSLDTENASSIIGLMIELNRAFGTTVLFSTHDPRMLAHVERRVTLQDGRIVAS